MKKTEIPKPVSIELKSSQYQPKKAEKEIETDMPEMSDDQLRDTFFRPFKIKEET
ncbi:MAG: hypothetical protein OXG88_10390 [Gammaproteobacteria bacterium]|nr:hypothetical protein [Gammaproteobacteria bacterium]